MESEKIVSGLRIWNLGRGASRTRRARTGLGGMDRGLKAPTNAFAFGVWSPLPLH